MGIDAYLIHTCKTQRPRIVQDEYNHNVEALDDWLLDQPCRLIIRTQRVALSELAEKPILTTYMLLLPPYADVAQGDRVVDVVYEDGTIEAGPFEIESVLPRRGRAERHRTVILERVG